MDGWQQAFAPGEFFTVPPLPNVTSVNVLGDFGIAADRLAIVDGESKSFFLCGFSFASSPAFARQSLHPPTPFSFEIT